MALTDLHEKFLHWLEVGQSARPQTLTSYRSDFTKFTTFLTHHRRRHDLRSFAFEPLRDFQLALAESVNHQGEHPSPQTISRHLSSLSSFGEWLVRFGYLQANPAKRLIRPKRTRTLPEILTGEQVDAVLALPLSPKEAAMRALFLWTGLRRGGLIALDWRHVDTQGRTLSIVNKGGHHDRIPLSPVVVAALTDYLLAVGPQEAQQPVFVGKQGRRIDRHVVNAVVRRWGRQAGIPGLHPHRFRHTLAYCLLITTGRLDLVQKLLGHADPRTTQLYAPVAPQQLREAIESFSYSKIGADMDYRR